MKTREEAIAELTEDIVLINAEAWHHFKFCEFCIPGAIDMPPENRFCSEGLSYYNRMQKTDEES